MFVVLAMMMTYEISKQGVKINFLMLRLYIIKYMHQYKQLTKAETGKVGPLFYPAIISINAALVLAMVLFRGRTRAPQSLNQPS
jgi:hypothetical protein